jgi:hypothetical protein
MFLLLACVTPPPAGGQTPADDTALPTDTAAPADTGPVGETFLLGGTCTPPIALSPDTVVLEGEARVTKEQEVRAMEALDIEVQGERAYIAGKGGLLVFDLADLSAPVLLNEPLPLSTGVLHRVEPLHGTYVATTARSVGLRLFDVADGAAPHELLTVPLIGAEGLAWVDDRLWVTVRNEGVRAYDVSNPAAPFELARAPGLSTPWELAATGDGWLYAADNTLGVVPIDIRDPDHPFVGSAVPTSGVTLHVRYADDRLYASLGADGVGVYDVTDRARPVLLHVLETGGSAVMADVADRVLWVADHEGFATFDLTSDPPAPIDRQRTEQFALAIDAEANRAFVGDWSLFEVWLRNTDQRAPAVDLPSLELRHADGEAETVITNRGAAPLSIHGASAEDPALRITVETLTIPPGGTARLHVEGLSDDTRFCLVTDDPDEPVLSLDVVATGAPPVGTVAPDFILDDLDGVPHHLGEQLGAPVLLAYFATS